jgi:hypothetical protein
MFPSLRLAILLLLCAAGEIVRALPGDMLSDRILTGDSPPPVGTTVGMSVEPGEINEAAAPAGAQDRSLWYEYTSQLNLEGKLYVWVRFTGAEGIMGVAAYSLAAGTPTVEMSSLRPAGACTAGPGQRELSLRLWLRPRERVILRIWTAPLPGSPNDAGAPFTLDTFFDDPPMQQGDTPDNPLHFPSSFGPGEVQTHSRYLGRGGFTWRLTTGTEDTLIGGNWYPAAAVFWYEWQALQTGRFRFSLAGRHAAYGKLLLAKKQGTDLELLAPPDGSILCDAIAGETYLIRIGDLGYLDNADGDLYLIGGPAEPGDAPPSARPLSPGIPATVRIAGASPPSPLTYSVPYTPVPRPGDLTPNLPDVWFDLGTTLDGVWQVDGGGGMVIVYRGNAAGVPTDLVAGGSLSEDTAFFAESGTRYFARVTWRELSEHPPVWQVVLEPGIQPPSHDRRDGAIPLSAATLPVIVRGNATGATAEASDWSNHGSAPRGRTVWYALDQPASAQPWFVSAWNHAVLPVSVFREEGGALVSAQFTGPGDPSRFTLHGGRVWIMVPANTDSRFMLMTGPAVSPGDSFADAVPLTPGVREFHYPGVTTRETGEPGGMSSMWHQWTATASGLHFSTRGSASPRRTLIFTGSDLAALTAVPAVTYNATAIEDGQRVESFQAEAGVTYRFQTSAHWEPFPPFCTWLRPGGWDSPYDVWRQNWPAWDDDPSIADPLADTDGDGIANVMEMATPDIRGLVLPDPPGFPWASVLGPPPQLEVFWGERSYALRGPLGCTPFRLTGEVSADFITWTAAHEPAPPDALLDYNYLWIYPRPEEALTKFFRLRVHR